MFRKTDMAEEKERKKPRRRFKVLYVFLIILFVFIGLYCLYRYRLKSLLASRIDEIQAAGFPATCQELDEWYSIPEDVNNAADILMDAFLLYIEWNDTNNPLPVIGEGKIPGRSEQFSAKNLELIAEHLEKNKKYFELLHKGINIQHCRYPVDFRMVSGVVMPQLRELRTAARNLQLEVYWYAEQDQTEAALNSIEDIFRLADTLSREPTMISQLVQIALKGLAISTIERVSNRTEFTEPQLIRLQEILSKAIDADMMYYGFVGERCFYVSVYKDGTKALFDFYYGTNRFWDLVFIPYYISGLAEQDTIILVDVMTKCIKALKLPEEERLRKVQAIEAKVDDLSRIHILAHMLVPAASRCVILELRMNANLDAALIATTVKRYRLANGVYPDTLTQLIPNYLEEVPVDPFDGNDIRYKQLNPGFVVYSIGEDLVDNGGLERDPNSRSEEYDNPFIIEH